MGAKIGEWRNLPGPKSAELTAKRKQYGLSAVHSDEIVLGTRGFDGATVEDADGNKYLDFFAGAGVSNLGHGAEEIKKLIYGQIWRGAWQYDESVFSNESAVSLRERLAKAMSEGIPYKVGFKNSGAEAIELALKLCINRNAERKYFINFSGSFHGRTLGALSVSSSKKIHKLGFPRVVDVISAEFPFRDNFDDFLKTIENAAVSPREINAVFIELIQGEGGVNIADSSAVHKIYNWAKRNGILFVVDEIQTGFGRTGTLFAYEHYGIVPDIVAAAKAISGGAVPAGAVIARDDLDFNELGRDGSTNAANMLACEAMHGVLNFFEENPDIYKETQEKGNYLREKLDEYSNTLSSFSSIGNTARIRDVRGLGLMCAVDTRIVFSRKGDSENFRDDVKNECLRRGLIVATAGPAGIRLTPPLVVSYEEIDTAIEIIKDAFEVVAVNYGV